MIKNFILLVLKSVATIFENEPEKDVPQQIPVSG